MTMTSRERVKTIIAGKAADRCGLWLGIPHKETWPIYHRYFGTSTEDELRVKLGDDIRWITPECSAYGASMYQHPEGKPYFPRVNAKAHGDAGPLADVEDPAEVDRFEWGNPDYLDFDRALEMLKNAGPFYRPSGLWTPFYHHVMALFGMEQYFIKMFTHPEVVHEVTRRVCEFYLEGNARFFEAMGDEADAFFFGNDFGTQIDLICGPAQFNEFIMPWFVRFIDLGRRYGKQVILHSCGSIYKVLDQLITAGVDAVNPLQAKAANMDADTLSREFKGRMAFIGGIDTQDLLVNGTPADVKADVRRVKALLGPSFIVSPSHETVLPNVPPQNIAAMAEAALE